MCEKSQSRADFVGLDLFGYEYNCKYPPNIEQNGNDYGGYASPNQYSFFYDFCIHQYGVAFSYEDDLYEAEFTGHGPILVNRLTNEVQVPCEDAVKLLEESSIKGNKLINILDNLNNVVLH